MLLVLESQDHSALLLLISLRICEQPENNTSCLSPELPLPAKHPSFYPFLLMWGRSHPLTHVVPPSAPDAFLLTHSHSGTLLLSPSSFHFVSLLLFLLLSTGSHLRDYKHTEILSSLKCFPSTLFLPYPEPHFSSPLLAQESFMLPFPISLCPIYLENTLVWLLIQTIPPNYPCQAGNTLSCQI